MFTHVLYVHMCIYTYIYTVHTFFLNSHKEIRALVHQSQCHGKAHQCALIQHFCARNDRWAAGHLADSFSIYLAALLCHSVKWRVKPRNNAHVGNVSLNFHCHCDSGQRWCCHCDSGLLSDHDYSKCTWYWS